jgi:XTP/dITP diphosphohydrolase
VSTFVLATANPHKAAELRAVLDVLGVTLLPRPTDVAQVEETSDTLEGNASLKARALVEATGFAALADDTGLFVDVLEGRPGVRSARYAGEGASDADNVERLLSELVDVHLDERGARFVTVIVAAYPDGSSIVVRGELEGVIDHHPRGEHGFGYDPVFVPLGSGGRTLAQMTPQEKNAISHRSRAVRNLVAALSNS